MYLFWFNSGFYQYSASCITKMVQKSLEIKTKERLFFLDCTAFFALHVSTGYTNLGGLKFIWILSAKVVDLFLEYIPQFIVDF